MQEYKKAVPFYKMQCIKNDTCGAYWQYATVYCEGPLRGLDSIYTYSLVS